MRLRATTTIVAVFAPLFLVGCGIFLPAKGVKAEDNMTLTLQSAAIRDGGEIPTKYTCEGADISPPLAWNGVPEGTRSLVLIVDDPDAPDPRAPRMTWVHWVVYNIPSDAGGLAEGTASATLPPGTEQGLNDWKRGTYGGPCPPIGRHRYFHKLYAVDTVLTFKSKPTKAEIETALEGHVIEQTELIGTYEKTR